MLQRRLLSAELFFAMFRIRQCPIEAVQRTGYKLPCWDASNDGNKFSFEVEGLTDSGSLPADMCSSVSAGALCRIKTLWQ